jgi:hypothetical protein
MDEHIKEAHIRRLKTNLNSFKDLMDRIKCDKDCV